MFLVSSALVVSKKFVDRMKFIIHVTEVVEFTNRIVFYQLVHGVYIFISKSVNIIHINLFKIIIHRRLKVKIRS